MRAFALICASVAIGGCQVGGRSSEAMDADSQPSEYVYKFVEDGAPETKDVKTYESLGDKTFTRVQKYKIIGQTDASRRYHLLIAKTELRVGKKKISSQEATLIPIVDGSYIYECSNYYDVKSSTPDSDIDDPVCKVEPIGVVLTSSPAKFVSKGSGA